MLYDILPDCKIVTLVFGKFMCGAAEKDFHLA
jgi:hypothetical protein